VGTGSNRKWLEWEHLVGTNEGIDGPVAQSIHSLKQWIKQTQPHILGDETPWVVKGVKQWLWIFANSDFP
jgi:transposase